MDLADLQIYHTSFPADGTRVSSSNKADGREVSWEGHLFLNHCHIVWANGRHFFFLMHECRSMLKPCYESTSFIDWVSV